MTDKYAVIGHPIAHSKSPLIHAAFAKQTQQTISYERVLAPLDGFTAKVRELIALGYKGVNVTVPFKFEAFNLCDALTDRAKSARAVNTLSFVNDRIEGDNTDGAGLVADITQNKHFSLMQKSVLLMGAGGAAYGVVLPLLNAGAKLTVANRTPAKAEQLLSTFEHFDMQVGSYEHFASTAFDVVINATSTGLTDDLPAITVANFAKDCLAYDMMYGRETKFKALALSAKVDFADGLGMLVEQAAEAFALWRGVRPETAPVIDALRDGTLI